MHTTTNNTEPEPTQGTMDGPRKKRGKMVNDMSITVAGIGSVTSGGGGDGGNEYSVNYTATNQTGTTGGGRTPSIIVPDEQITNISKQLQLKRKTSETQLESIKMSEKKRQTLLKLYYPLPYWCRLLAWVLLITIVLICSVIVILWGLQFDIQWEARVNPTEDPFLFSNCADFADVSYEQWINYC